MKVLKPRSRMISIRLSQEEYEGLCHLSTVTGAHSLSALARDAMRSFLSVAMHQRVMTDPAVAVQLQMEMLNRRIDELAQRVTTPGQPTTQGRS